jgi:hypothetical protein
MGRMREGPSSWRLRGVTTHIRAVGALPIRPLCCPIDRIVYLASVNDPTDHLVAWLKNRADLPVDSVARADEPPGIDLVALVDSAVTSMPIPMTCK